MRYFIFSDVHGCYSRLCEELNNKGFDVNNPNHMLISLGDNFDRGKENYQMFLFLKEMKEKNKIILIRGNHEDIMLRMFSTGKVTNTDYINGTYNTIEELAMVYFGKEGYGMFMNNFDKLYYKLKEEKLFDLLYDMIDYYETKNYIFTHGFIPVLGEKNFKYNPLWREVDKLEFYKARWLNGPEMSIKYGIGERSKKIIIGHKCIERARILKGEDKNDLSIYEDDNIILLDAHTVISNQLNILVIEEE
jgi:serine/threonine protein phosphatase 1